MDRFPDLETLLLSAKRIEKNKKVTMNANTPVESPHEDSDLTGKILKRMVQVIVLMLLMVAILFVSAGRLDWMWAWIYFGVYLAGIAFNALYIVPKNPEMIAERGEIREGAKGWDKTLGIIIAIPTLGLLIVAGLDVRFGWTPPLPLAVHTMALVVAGLGYALFSWALASNKFFSSVVRIQMDRGHTVASGGPYQYVRHPGYVAMIISTLATPLMLGSLWALIPAGLVACLYVARTALEDKTLQEELSGYRDYAQQVRYRLLPGIW